MRFGRHNAVDQNNGHTPTFGSVITKVLSRVADGLASKGTVDRLRDWCGQKRGNQARLARHLGCRTGTVTNWLKERRYPDLEDTIRINAFLDLAIPQCPEHRPQDPERHIPMRDPRCKMPVVPSMPSREPEGGAISNKTSDEHPLDINGIFKSCWGQVDTSCPPILLQETEPSGRREEMKFSLWREIEKKEREIFILKEQIAAL
jgi:transcriptional regulator with XRE-family HTH domain